MFVLMILIYYAAEAGGNFTNAAVANSLSLLCVADVCRLTVCLVSTETRASAEPLMTVRLVMSAGRHCVHMELSEVKPVVPVDALSTSESLRKLSLLQRLVYIYSYFKICISLRL